MLYNLDVGNKEWYNSLDSELKKTFSSYVSMRFASSVKSNKILQESYIESVNEFCNKYFSTIQKHEGDSLLFWKLLCLCGSGQKQFHPLQCVNYYSHQLFQRGTATGSGLCPVIEFCGDKSFCTILNLVPTYIA